MPDIKIEDGVAIGANSFVNKSCEKWKIYAGSPIKYIKDRQTDCLKLLKEMNEDKL
jgi:galactoside O-acetyltransferase